MKTNYLLTSTGICFFLSFYLIFPRLAIAETKASKPQLIADSTGKDAGSASPAVPSPDSSASPAVPSPDSSAPLAVPSPDKTAPSTVPSPDSSALPMLPSAGSEISPTTANQEYVDQAKVERDRSARQAAEQQAAEQARIQEEQRKAAAEQARRAQAAAAEQASAQAAQLSQSETAAQQNEPPAVSLAPSPEPPVVSAGVGPSTKKLKVEQVAFLCETQNGVPTTIAKDKDNKNVLIILWKSDVFNASGYNPQERCKQASSRFELFRKNQNFVYLTVGTINGHPSICLTSKENGTCGEGIQLNQGLLYTLRPNSNPQEILDKLAIALQSTASSTQAALEE